MATEYELRGQLATCTRIFAMQGMIGVFGHVSVYQPESKRVFITPGMKKPADRTWTRCKNWGWKNSKSGANWTEQYCNGEIHFAFAVVPPKAKTQAHFSLA